MAWLRSWGLALSGQLEMMACLQAFRPVCLSTKSLRLASHAGALLGCKQTLVGVTYCGVLAPWLVVGQKWRDLKIY